MTQQNPKHLDAESWLSISDAHLFGPYVAPELFVHHGELLFERLTWLKEKVVPELIAAIQTKNDVLGMAPAYPLLKAVATVTYCSVAAASLERAEQRDMLQPVADKLMQRLIEGATEVMKQVAPVRIVTREDLERWLEEERFRLVGLAVFLKPGDKIAAAKHALSMATIKQFEAELALMTLEAETAPASADVGE